MKISNFKFLNKLDQLSEYKIIIKFFLKTFFLVVLLWLVKLIHRALIESSSDNLFSKYLQELNIYELFANSLTYSAQIILNIFGFETVLGNRTIAIIGSRGVIIHGPCLGVDVIGVFIALIIAYPSKVRLSIKIMYILFGVLMILLLNVLRVVALLLKNKYSFELYINHHDLYNIVIYGFVILGFYFWIKYSSSSSPIGKRENIA